jgi:hypothetical protein
MQLSRRPGTRKSAGDQDALKRVVISAEPDAYKIVKLNRCNTLVHTGDNLLRDCCCVDMLGVETITQTRDSSCDLVELNALLASIYRLISGNLRVLKAGYIPRLNTNMMATWSGALAGDGGVDGERRGNLCSLYVSMWKLQWD